MADMITGAGCGILLSKLLPEWLPSLVMRLFMRRGSPADGSWEAAVRWKYSAVRFEENDRRKDYQVRSVRRTDRQIYPPSSRSYVCTAWIDQNALGCSGLTAYRIYRRCAEVYTKDVRRQELRKYKESQKEKKQAWVP